MTQNPSLTKLIMLLIAIFGIAAGYMYHAFWSDASVPEISVVLPKSDLGAYEKIKINFAELESDANYQNLQIYGEDPVSPGTPGKPNIFSPLQAGIGI